MAAPLYTPASGYGTKQGDYYYSQTPSGGIWSKTPMSYGYTPSNGQVLGASNVNTGGGGGGSAPVDTGVQAPVDTGPSMEDLINEVFAPTMDYLSQAEATIQSQRPGIEQEITGQYQTAKESLGGERESGQRKLEEQGQAAFQRKEDASAQARRLYGELKTGGRQRFGGSTSAGEAYGELIGTQLQRQLGTTQTNYNTAMMQINSAEQDLQSRYDTALKELENQKIASLNEARRYFDDKLLEITRLKGEAESSKASSKANARLQALQDLRNKVYAINMQDYQYKQQLAANYQTTQSAVEASKQRLLQSVGMGTTAYQNFLSNSTVNPSNQLAFGGNAPVSGPSYTGVIKKDEEQYLT